MKAYLAGPEVFLPSAKEVGEHKKSICRDFGFEPLFPLDNEVEGKNISKQIFLNNINLINSADILLANLTPFRGPSADAGTITEVGYGYGKIPIYGYSFDSRLYKEKIYKDGYEIENFGLMDNLMIHHMCEDIIEIDIKNTIWSPTGFVYVMKQLQELYKPY